MTREFGRSLRQGGAAAAVVALVLGALRLFVPEEGGDIEAVIGRGLPVWTVAPFVAMLLAIAVIPLAAAAWWESNRHKAIVAAALSLPVVGLFLAGVPQGAEALLLTAHEYVAFLLLLFALFTISGGIYIEGDFMATPRLNTGVLGLGALMASTVGTTGAAMLLIRPLLRINRQRRRTRHLYIFFIFLVGNIGGLLTPLGDPPLFLGYLRGVPFTWTLQLWREWAVAVGVLLALVYVWDRWAYRREARVDTERDEREREPLRVRGWHNVVLLGMVVVATAFLHGEATLGSVTLDLSWLRDPLLFLLALTSYLWDRRTSTLPGNTEPTSRERNGFTFHAITEVGVLFAGIFATMLPALCLLKARGASLGVDEPWQFFWLSGGLSSFLDNAPTYLTFFALGQGLDACGQASAMCTAGVPYVILQAISCGAVFMGANTYIGNAPNFMVKSLVEEYGVDMPGFFGYMLYSVCILLPLFGLLTWLFF